MTKSTNDDESYKGILLSRKETYPEAEAVFTSKLKPINEIKEDCIIVLDTNILAIPYLISSSGLNDIQNTYQKLVEKKQLLIPAHVAREFAGVRASKIMDLIKQINDEKSKINSPHFSHWPLLESLPDYQKAKNLQKELERLRKDFMQVVGKVVDHIKDWTWNDPVSSIYGELFNQEIIIDISLSGEELKKDLERRRKHNIPPGYKDAGKENNSDGDLIIWHTILEIGRIQKKDLIFVSADQKPDWFHRSNNEHIYPRYELVDEYRRASGGGSFHIIELSKLLTLYDAEKETVEEVQQQELQEQIDINFTQSNFAFIAEKAVKKWLTVKYPNNAIVLNHIVLSEDGAHEETGFLIENTDNNTQIFIEIKYIFGEKPSLSTLNSILNLYNAPNIKTEKLIVVVGSNVEDTISLATLFRPLSVNLIRHHNTYVVFGYLNKYGLFEELFE